MSYMGFPMSATAVNRCWWHDFRGKGGMTCIQALLCNRGEPMVAGKKAQGGITIKTIIEVIIGSQTSP
jgi:hypothetical protein